MTSKPAFPILLLDDDDRVAEILGRALKTSFPESELHHVLALSEAIAYLDSMTNKCKLGVILLDIDLGSQHNGIELLNSLRKHRHCRLTPVIVLSTQTKTEIILESYDKGVNAYTNKPFTFSEWKVYVERLRAFWYDTATNPNFFR